MNQAVTRQLKSMARMPVTRRRKSYAPMPNLQFLSRGKMGPVHISKLLDPIMKICNHPDRDRLLARFLFGK